jgi:hypothetical protein
MSSPHRCLAEEDLHFEFQDGWTRVVAWDLHPAYLKGMRKTDQGKAVDFIGIYRNDTLFFIEVTDYRPHRTGGAPRTVKIGEVMREFEQKVRDTVASLVGAYRDGRYDDACQAVVQGLIERPRRELKLVLWLEDSSPPTITQVAHEARRKARASLHAQKSKPHLKWLDARVLVVSKAKDYEKAIPALTVTSLPVDLRERANLVLTTLERRGLEIPDAVPQQLTVWLTGNDTKEIKRRINSWLGRAATVTSARQLID